MCETGLRKINKDKQTRERESDARCEIRLKICEDDDGRREEEEKKNSCYSVVDQIRLQFQCGGSWHSAHRLRCWDSNMYYCLCGVVYTQSHSYNSRL